MDQKPTLDSIISYYRFDAARRSERLSLMGLGSSEYRLALLLHDAAIKPNSHEIVDNFYRLMQQVPEFMHIIRKHSSIETQKKYMRRYISSLGINYNEADYFESRLRIGQVHNRAGVSLSLYIGAYRILQQLILDAIPKKSSKREVLISYLLKIIHLDMSLAIDAYHQDDVSHLLDNLRLVASNYEELKMRQERDTLTQVFSRDGVMNLVRSDLVVFVENNAPFCLAMVDIDHFKHVNDNFGHLVGDAVLHDVASRIQRQLRGGDVIGRYGGEEFLLLFHGIELEKAAEICERIRKFIADSPIVTSGVTVPITISIGVAQPVRGDDSSSLIERADRALYAAKNSGRNKVVKETEA